MATDTTAPAKPETKQLTGDPAAPTGKVLPLILLAVLLVALGYGVHRFVNFITAAQATEAVETKFVFRRLTESVQLFAPIPLGGREISGRAFWLTLLFIPPLIGVAVLLVRHFVRKRPFRLENGIVVGVLFVPALVATFLSTRMAPRAQYLEVDPAMFWIPTLIAVLAVGLVYVIWMYMRDAGAVGWAWATFLGATRFAVYLLLASIFLLPALQTWEKTEAHSRVLILLDVSGSMNQADVVAEEGKPLPPTRLDQVLHLINDKDQAFVKALLKNNPVVVYNFGGKLDEDYKELKPDGKPWTAADWAAFARLDLKLWFLDGLSEDGQRVVSSSEGFEAGKPGTPEWASQWAKDTTFEVKDLPETPENAQANLKKLSPQDKEKFDAKKERIEKRILLNRDLATGSNYGDSVLTALARESTNMLAGIIVIGDGHSNQGSPSTYEELRRRASNLKVPLFTVAVGEVREQVNTRITDTQSPEQAPPDDKFMVRLEVDGEGQADKEFTATLDIYKPGDPKTPALQLTKTGKFKAVGGGLPHGTLEWIIDPASDEFAALRSAAATGKPEFQEGEYRFIARIPKAKGEPEPKKEHVGDAAVTQIIKKPLRVLLFAGGPTREYQFARRLFVNEEDKKRAELSICLQVTDPKGARVQDVPQERLLKTFPSFLRVEDDPNEKPEDKYYNLAQYDLIIAFDPDWLQVPLESLVLLQKWVDLQAGGLIIVGGPIHTFQMARGGNQERLRPIIDLSPVRVEDSRLAGLGVERTTAKPWRLNFPGASAESDYLKIDEDKKELLDGWKDFFGAGEPPLRGIYSYYPIKAVKPTATTVATFADPQAFVTKDDNSTEPMPYVVTMPYGKGKTIWVGSGELWRLRLFKELYHERFWTKLGRFAASGTQTRQTRRGQINISRQYTVGSYARPNVSLFGPDLNPLPASAEPQIKIIPPAGSNVTANPLKLSPLREGEWAGRFQGRFLVNAPGEWNLELPVPGSSEVIRSKFIVRESNPELDNVRPDFGLLRTQLAGTVADLRLGDSGKSELKARLRNTPATPDKTKGEVAPPPDSGKDDETKLYFDLRTARIIPDFIKGEHREQRSRGPIQDLWPAGPQMSLFGIRGAVGLIMLIVIGLL
ncbi:MAG: hypothetical protein JNM56_20025, partial [Planctomycetia bacterium]|nr:hypothetical protein [Planctomycetia bacterium]